MFIPAGGGDIDQVGRREFERGQMGEREGWHNVVLAERPFSVAANNPRGAAPRPTARTSSRTAMPSSFGARRRIELHDKRIVTRNDVILVGRQLQQPVKTLQHFADMERRRERPLARHVLVEMGDVGSDQDISARGS